MGSASDILFESNRIDYCQEERQQFPHGLMYRVNHSQVNPRKMDPASPHFVIASILTVA